MIKTGPIPAKPVIGQYIDTYLPAVDGVIMTVHNYALWLNRQGFLCYVAAAMAPPGYQEPASYPIIRYRSAPIAQRPPYRYGFPLLDSRFISATSDMMPGLVHAHSPFNAGLEARRMARRYKIPLVASFHSKYYDDVLQATKSKFLADIAVEHIVRFYHSADIVWTVSQGTAETLRSYGYQKAIEIMPNGTDLSMPSDISGARAMVEARYGLLPQDRVLLFVGQHILQKNLMLLLDAFALVARTDPQVMLLMVGEGYAKKQLQEYAVALGISRRVIFADVVRDRNVLTAIYLRADLFTFPSVYDNAPLVVREAASAGCPAVLISGSNAAEGTRDGVNAFLCEETAASLCQAIQRALRDDTLRHDVALKAAETLGRTWDDIIRDVGDRYCEIIREYQPKPLILIRQLDRKNRDVLRAVILRQLQQAKAAGEKNLLALKRQRSLKGSRNILWMPKDPVKLLKIFPLLPDQRKRRRHHENPDD